MPVSLSKEKNKRWSEGSVVQEKWESYGKKKRLLLMFRV